MRWNIQDMDRAHVALGQWVKAELLPALKAAEAKRLPRVRRVPCDYDMRGTMRRYEIGE